MENKDTLNETVSTVRPTEAIIVSVAFFLFSMWHLYAFIAWGGIISLFFAGAGFYVGIGLLRKSRVAYIVGIILAVLVLYFMSLSAASYIFKFIFGNFQHRLAYTELERDLIWGVLSIFVLYCLRTHRAKNYFQAIRKEKHKL